MKWWDASFRMSATASDPTAFEAVFGQSSGTTPWASQDWANTKAGYRFSDNERISEANILADHFTSTRERFAASSGFPVHASGEWARRLGCS
jgi:Transposase DNA-binding